MIRMIATSTQIQMGIPRILGTPFGLSSFRIRDKA
jgi:hypothetical protein